MFARLADRIRVTSISSLPHALHYDQEQRRIGLGVELLRPRLTFVFLDAEGEAVALEQIDGAVGAALFGPLGVGEVDLLGLPVGRQPIAVAILLLLVFLVLNRIAVKDQKQVAQVLG